jgi:hypothetical protein
MSKVKQVLSHTKSDCIHRVRLAATSLTVSEDRHGTTRKGKMYKLTIQVSSTPSQMLDIAYLVLRHQTNIHLVVGSSRSKGNIRSE